MKFSPPNSYERLVQTSRDKTRKVTLKRRAQNIERAVATAGHAAQRVAARLCTDSECKVVLQSRGIHAGLIPGSEKRSTVVHQCADFSLERAV